MPKAQIGIIGLTATGGPWSPDYGDQIAAGPLGSPVRTVACVLLGLAKMAFELPLSNGKRQEPRTAAARAKDDYPDRKQAKTSKPNNVSGNCRDE
jgi:hypothetical protein